MGSVIAWWVWTCSLLATIIYLSLATPLPGGNPFLSGALLGLALAWALVVLVQEIRKIRY